MSKQKDPIMKRIRANIEPQKEKLNKKEEKHKKGRYFYSILVFIIIAATVGFNFYKVLKEGEKKQKEIYKEIISSKAQIITSSLEQYYYMHKQYPENLNNDFIEKKVSNYDVVEIDLSNYKYKTRGRGYELCFRSDNYNKCWENY